MRKYRIISILLVACCWLCACTNEAEGVTNVEWVESQHTFTPFFGFYSAGGEQVLYYYHYFGNTIEIENASESMNADISKYSIELLDYEGNSAVTMVGFHKTNHSNNSYLNKGTVLAFYVFYANDITEAHISIKFYDTEIYNGIVYKDKGPHEAVHTITKGR